MHRPRRVGVRARDARNGRKPGGPYNQTQKFVYEDVSS
jgi:hypothetical protein